MRDAHRQPMQQQRGDTNRLSSRHGGPGARNAAPDRNRDRGDNQLGDRLALARGIDMPASRRTAKASGNGTPAPSSETDDATGGSAQLQRSLTPRQDGHVEEDYQVNLQDQESQSAPPLEQPQATRGGLSEFDSDTSAMNTASAFQEADHDFERLMKEMVRHYVDSTSTCYSPQKTVICALRCRAGTVTVERSTTTRVEVLTM